MIPLIPAILIGIAGYLFFKDRSNAPQENDNSAGGSRNRILPVPSGQPGRSESDPSTNPVSPGNNGDDNIAGVGGGGGIDCPLRSEVVVTDRPEISAQQELEK